MSESGPDLKIVPLFSQAMAIDIVGSLRRSADSVEAETEKDDRTVAMIAVQVTEGGKLKTYGWGDTSRFHAIGVLTAAAADL